MYTVIVEARFRAVHRLRRRDGTLEPQHGHEWRVRACFAGRELDDADMVIDFHEARSALWAVVEHLHNGDLNRCEVLAGRNPTAEVVAEHVFERLRRSGLSMIRRVEVTERPGCVASYEPGA